MTDREAYEARIEAVARAMAVSEDRDWTSLPADLEHCPAPWDAMLGDTKSDWLELARTADAVVLKAIEEPTLKMVIGAPHAGFHDVPDRVKVATEAWRIMWSAIPRGTS